MSDNEDDITGDDNWVDDITFNVYYGGKWVKAGWNDESYVGGEMKIIDCKAKDFFATITSDLSLSLNGKLLWYTFPFEDNKDKKLMSENDDSFTKMCDGARWVKVMNVFVTDDMDYDECEETQSPPCEEELRVERNVAPFHDVDEDENFDYHNTPPNSDGEADDRDDYVRCKPGSGELKLMQVFDSIEEFKDALIDYALKGGWNIELTRWGRKNCQAECAVDDYGKTCKWRIYCSYEEPIGNYMVKSYEDKHTCVKDGYCKMLKSRVIAKLFLDEIREDPDFSPKRMQDMIEQNYNLITNRDKCKKGKRIALDMIKQEHEEQFYRMRDYRIELRRSNPGSSIDLETIVDDQGVELFHRLYVCFANIREQWNTWCRPIFGLDGCFLKSTYKGQLLAAVGRDANNGMYPFAWAVVDIEKEDNWVWFIQKLKKDFPRISDGHGFTVISDRQKGLLNAVDREWPKIEHRMCARHIYGNLKKQFPRQSELKGLFWRVVESYTMAEYEAALERVKSYDLTLFQAIMEKNPQNCSLVFFTATACCVDVHNNISESFNNAINPSRYMPMVEMLETIRRRTMQRIELRRKIAKNYNGRFTKRAADAIAIEQDKLKFVKYVSGSAEGRCEVLDHGKSVSVNMQMRTCACRKWEMSGLPCRHALRVIAKKNLNYTDYTSEWFSNAKQQHIYDYSIEPVNGMKYWKKSGEVIKVPPHLLKEDHKKGRKPKPKRIKERHESPPKKASRKNRTMHCGNCGIAGHNAKNAKKCPNFGVRKRKRNEPMENEDGDGESQPTQE